MADFTITKDARLPSLRCRLTGPSIETASACTFAMVAHGGTTVKNGGTCTIESTDVDLIVVRYDFAAADTDTAGKWDGKFTATVGGKSMKVPNDHFVTVEVVADAA